MDDIRQTPAYAKHLRALGWTVVEKKGVYYFLKRFFVFGSLLKIQRPEFIDLRCINQLAKQYQVFQIMIEPKDDLQAKFLLHSGYSPTKNNFLPTLTLQLELTQPEDYLLSRFKKDCRRTLAKNQALKFRTYDLTEIEQFRSGWKKAVGLKRYVPAVKVLKSLKQLFNGQSLFLSDSNLTAGAIFIAGDKVAYYWQAFASRQGRKNQIQYSLVWEGIRWAKKRGVKIFDFEGVYDRRFPNTAWLGFSHFKKSFSGQEVSYPGCYNHYRFPR